MNIGLCGTGRMGSAIARRLLDLGHTVTVWNRNRDKTRPLEEAGATVAETPADLAGRSEVIITMVLDDSALDSVLNGQGGLLRADLSGRLVIDMSTVLPETEARAGAAVKAAGGAFVECPVGGTIGPARDGKLLALVGGEEADVARARPLLESLSRRIEHVGPVGSGARLKLAINLPLLVYWQALGEALALAQPLGLPPERLVDILADTSGTPLGMKMRAPDIARALAGEKLGPPAFDVRGVRKDLSLMVTYGRSLGIDLPVTRSAAAAFDEAAQSDLADQDAVSVPVRFATRNARKA